MPEQIKLKELEEIGQDMMIEDSDDEPVMLSDVGSDDDDDNVEDILSDDDDDDDSIGGTLSDDDDNIGGGVSDDEEEEDNPENSKSPSNSTSLLNIEDDDESDSDMDEHQKLDREEIDKFIVEHHPESITHNKEEIEALSKIFRNKDGEIEDEFHNTVPFITRFERAKVLGARARQLNKDPSQALVKVDLSIIDGYKIALEEYKQKKIPFIIKRPLPNGSCEYWKFEDLEQIE